MVIVHALQPIECGYRLHVLGVSDNHIDIHSHWRIPRLTSKGRCMDTAGVARKQMRHNAANRFAGFETT